VSAQQATLSSIPHPIYIIIIRSGGNNNNNDNSMALYSILFFLLLPLQIDQNVYCYSSASSLTPFFVIHKSGLEA
jgi:hypothetical protein